LLVEDFGGGCCGVVVVVGGVVEGFPQAGGRRGFCHRVRVGDMKLVCGTRWVCKLKVTRLRMELQLG
jgi:hypothetical protein